MGYLDRAAEASVSRRGFVKAGAAVTAAAAFTGALAGCSPQSENAVELSETGAAEAGANPEEGAVWQPVSCWLGCGTAACRNMGLVKDGVVLRQKSDDSHEDSVEHPQRRGCLRGRSQRKHVFSADRIKYPMKRKGWSSDNPNGAMRGKDEWERISWDEALQIIHDELQRAIDTYGPASILAHGEVTGLLNKLGGYTTYWSTHSFGSYSLSVRFNGYHHHGKAVCNDRLTMAKSETVVMFGVNPAWSGCGTQSWYWEQVKQAGAKFIAVDPRYNDSYAMLNAEWIPIYPGQDDALILGIAYVLLTQDDPEANPLIDWDFLSRCTIGFDADSMPKGADPKRNFRDYVLGTYDKTPKTPEWASKLCGVSAEQIHDLAYELKPEKKVSIVTSWAPSRRHDTDHLSQLFMTLGSMTGHFGKEGHMCGISCDAMTADGGPRLFSTGGSGNPDIENALDECINTGELWDSILKGEYTYNGRMPGYGFDNLDPIAEKRSCDIHVIYATGIGWLGSNENIDKGIEVFRKVDFVVAHAWAPNPPSIYADIVLPVTTPWERPGRISADGGRDTITIAQQVCDPIGEARSDQDVVRGLAPLFGFTEEDFYCGSEKQQFFNQIAGSTVFDPADGETPIPLVTITQADLDEWGVEGEPQEGQIALKEFCEQGVVTVHRTDGDTYTHIPFKAFRDDPEANPSENSESGKFEIYSQKMGDTLTAMGYGEVDPLAVYKEKAMGYEATFSDFDKGVKGEYPFQVFCLKTLRDVASTMDNVPQLRETIKNPVIMAASDARDLGIQTGDAVKVTSPTGCIIRKVSVTSRQMPGTLVVPWGGWYEYDEAAGGDIGGASNTLTGGVVTGQGTSGYNSVIAKVEKYTGTIVDDVEKAPVVFFEEDGE